MFSGCGAPGHSFNGLVWCDRLRTDPADWWTLSERTCRHTAMLTKTWIALKGDTDSCFLIGYIYNSYKMVDKAPENNCGINWLIYLKIVITIDQYFMIRILRNWFIQIKLWMVMCACYWEQLKSIIAYHTYHFGNRHFNWEVPPPRPT